jgi:hypothetical protein
MSGRRKGKGKGGAAGPATSARGGEGTAAAEPLEVVCPECRSLILVDPATGGVLEHKAPPKPKTFESFEDAVKAMKSADASSEDRFRASVDAEKKRAEILAKAFDDLVKKAEEEGPTPPPNPFDHD